MRLALLLLIGLTGCAVPKWTGATKEQRENGYFKADAAYSASAEHKASIEASAQTIEGIRAAQPPATPPKEQILHFRYPPGATNYWWDLQTSVNLKSWTTIQTNTGPGDVYVTNSSPVRFYRMFGRQ